MGVTESHFHMEATFLCERVGLLPILELFSKFTRY